MNPMLAKLKSASRRLETINPKLSLKLAQLAREIRGAKSSEISVDSWDDFASWWNTNRSQGLLFTITDALGEDNPVIGQMKEVMSAQDALEAKLHDIYLQLKGGGKAPAPATEAPAEAPAADAAPAIEAPLEEPVADLTEASVTAAMGGVELMVELATEIRSLVKAKKPLPYETAGDLASLVLDHHANGDIADGVHVDYGTQDD